MKIYTAFDTPPKVPIGNFGVSKTRQSEKDACDINKIVSRYKTTGVLPANTTAGIYADVTQMGDYRGAIEQVKMADDMFMKLPSGVRTKFDNDPALFLDFVSNKDNKAEMQKLGLIEPEPEPVEKVPPEPEVDS